MRRRAKVSYGLVGLLVGLLVVLVFVLTQTDYGRNRFREIGLRQLANQVHGIVEIGDVHGNLLSGATIEDVVITDSAGRPFLKADSVSLRYSLTSLFRKHILLEDVRLVRPVIVLDQRPGEKWNFQRLFPGDSAKAAAADSATGFGDWVRIEDLVLVDGTVLVRRAWSPPESLTGAALEAAIDRALSAANREHIVRVAGGFQALSSFRDVDGVFPLVLFADPDSAARIVHVAELSMIAQPFRPPSVRVVDMSGRIRIGADTIRFSDLNVDLPGSEIAMNGTYSVRDASFNARVRADTVTFSDFRFARPDLPDGGGHMNIAVAYEGGLTRAVLTGMEVRSGGAYVRGRIDVQLGDYFRIGGSNLAFNSVDTDFVERLASFDVPVDGVLSGQIRLAGASREMEVDGWTLFRDRAGGRSRITADGAIGSTPAGTIARDLHLRFDPVQVSVLEAVMPDLPVGGVITGRTTLNGNLNQRFDIDADFVHVDPDIGRSHVAVAGDLGIRGDFATSGLRLRFDPVQAALLRAFRPDLELAGQLTGTARLAGGLASGFDVNADVTHTGGGTGRSRIFADGRINLRDGMSARNLRLRFDPLDMQLVRSFVPAFDVPGTISGTATVTGMLASGFTVDADIYHSHSSTGRSHILAAGDVLTANGFTARGLRMRFDPLQVALLKHLDPTLPIDGIITGTATINGSPATVIAAVMDVTHDGSTGVSRLSGNAELAFADVLQRVEANLRVAPLALATAGLFAPAAGLHGFATGTLTARGTRSSIAFTTDLDVADGGDVFARGTVGLGPVFRYDVNSTLRAFDPAAVSTRAPEAALTGRIDATGSGTELATARAYVDAALIDSRITGTPAVDSTRVTATIADGLASIQRGHIRLSTATADVSGSFGLVPHRNGELRYTVAIDTLSRVVHFASGDTAVVYPRPAPQARRIAQARADSARIADQTMVQRAATGQPPPPPLVVDSLRPIPRDTVSGMLRAEGMLSGNITRFDAEGTATLRDVLFRGHAVSAGDLVYTLRNAPTDQLAMTLEGKLTGVQAAGFGFDSARIAVDNLGGWTEGSGTIDLAVYQDSDRDYRLSSDFVLALDRKELLLKDVALRFDTTLWRGTQPGAISWAASGVELRTIDLRNQSGGHIFADGRMPSEGSGDLRIEIDSLQIADLSALLQDTLNTRGMLSLDALVRGTAASPRITGTLALDSAARAGTALPAIRSTFAYADRHLTADALALSGERRLLDADISIPLNLAFTDRVGPLLPDGPIMIDARMDSLPLDAVPTFTKAVADLHGVVSGDVTVRGTYDNPQLAGLIQVNDGGARVVDAGVSLAAANGIFRFENNRVVIDSLVALSGGEPIRVTGVVDLATLTEPAFDLAVSATEAVVLDNEYGIVRADVDLTVEGPLDALRIEGTMAVQEGVLNAPEQTNIRRATNLDDPLLVGVLDSLNAGPEFQRGPNPILRNLVVDVRVTVARDTWVRNSALNVEVYTPDDVDPLRIHIDNATETLTLTGTINADRGEYSIAGRPFELTSGSLTFLGAAALDPVLQLNAQYAVPRRGQEALIIQINVTGYLSEPRLSLSSNAQPPLPESELISYLAFGRTSSSLLTQEGSGILGGGLGLLAEQQLAGLGLGAFTDALVRGFEEQGTDAGIDVFRLRPGTVPDELSVGGYFSNMLSGMELEAGEYFGQRLFGAVEARANGTLPGLRLEYETPGGFSWRATWESEYLPSEPSLADAKATTTKVFGTFFFWTRRY